jgi:hypothetical protein
MIETADDAAGAVKACRYFPRGGRSFGPLRAGLRFGRDPDVLGRLAHPGTLCLPTCGYGAAVTRGSKRATATAAEVMKAMTRLTVRLRTESAPADMAWTWSQLTTLGRIIE